MAPLPRRKKKTTREQLQPVFDIDLVQHFFYHMFSVSTNAGQLPAELWSMIIIALMQFDKAIPMRSSTGESILRGFQANLLDAFRCVSGPHVGKPYMNQAIEPRLTIVLHHFWTNVSINYILNLNALAFTGLGLEWYDWMNLDETQNLIITIVEEKSRHSVFYGSQKQKDLHLKLARFFKMILQSPRLKTLIIHFRLNHSRAREKGSIKSFIAQAIAPVTVASGLNSRILLVSDIDTRPDTYDENVAAPVTNVPKFDLNSEPGNYLGQKAEAFVRKIYEIYPEQMGLEMVGN